MLTGAERRHLLWLIWLFPLVFAVHDGEELITMVPWFRAHTALFQSGPLAWLSPTQGSVAVAIGLVALLILLATFLGDRAMRQGRLHPFFSAAAAGLFLNAFTHLGQSLIVGGYTPGVATVPILLLYALYLLRSLFAAGLLTWRRLGNSMALGGLLLVPLAVAAQAVGQVLFP